MNDIVYVVLFRGVGGATQLPTGPLRAALAEAGFRSVATYINSGNAIVASEKSANQVQATIAELTLREFGFNKHIMIAPRAEWDRLVKGNAFPEAVARPTTLHGFLLEKKPSPDAVEALHARAAALGSERVGIDGSHLYLHTPDGMGVSKLAPAIDRILGVASTARNWNTVLKLQAMAKAASA